jgi:hypothetical protein
VGVKRGENDVQGMISNMIGMKMKLVDGLPGPGVEGLFAAIGIEKELRLRFILYRNRSHRA